MADYIENKLIINCNDLIIKNKIKMLIFSENDKKEQIFTMEKMIPMPERFSDSVGYNEFGRDWSYALWGTKWAQSYNITESGDTIIIDYQTPWVPNFFWVEALCRFIDSVSYKCDKEIRKNISVNHFYCNQYEDFGIEIDWTLDKGYSLIENVRMFE